MHAAVILLLFTGCAMEFTGSKRSISIGMPKPPTNAIVSVSYVKVGIIIEQSPTTQSPNLTLGYQKGAYYRIPFGYSNVFVTPFESSTTTKTLFGTEISDKTSTK